jgi:hypothetical protein
LAQASPVVQAFPSSQAATLFECTQPVSGAHESLVHALLSSQLKLDVPTHVPLAHLSPVVQEFPSSQAAALFSWTQPLKGTQESFVHALLSSQFSADPAAHAPFAHASPVVQTFPSLQAFVLLVKTQPTAAEHESLVQALLSLQTRGCPDRHVPPTQKSPFVQAFWSEHSLKLFVWTQPTALSQSSVVHGLLSEQFNAPPVRHVPAEHRSLMVHGFPSLQAFVFGMKTQPMVGSHVSVVQRLWSLQVGAGPPTHVPFAQVPPIVHAFPSSHGDALLTWAHEDAGVSGFSQMSSVHGLKSSQSAFDLQPAPVSVARLPLGSVPGTVAAWRLACPRHSTNSADSTLLIAIPPIQLPLPDAPNPATGLVGR